VLRIVTTDIFDSWLADLSDSRARVKVLARIDRLERGNPGDVAPVGEGVSEMKINYGPGYRVYFVQRGRTVIVLLCGGTKQRQAADIIHAKALARLWKD